MNYLLKKEQKKKNNIPIVELLIGIIGVEDKGTNSMQTEKFD